MNDNKQDMSILKPCPFCGANAVLLKKENALNIHGVDLACCDQCALMMVVPIWQSRADLCAPVPAEESHSASVQVQEAFNVIDRSVSIGIDESGHSEYPNQDLHDAMAILYRAIHGLEMFGDDVQRAVILTKGQIKAALQSSPQFNTETHEDNKCPDCGSEMIEVCSGLEKICNEEHFGECPVGTDREPQGRSNTWVSNDVIEKIVNELNNGLGNCGCSNVGLCMKSCHMTLEQAANNTLTALQPYMKSAAPPHEQEM